eukprot:364577-Chlamydomonas_euryale.AAC.25
MQVCAALPTSALKACSTPPGRTQAAPASFMPVLSLQGDAVICVSGVGPVYNASLDGIWRCTALFTRAHGSTQQLRHMQTGVGCLRVVGLHYGATLRGNTMGQHYGATLWSTHRQHYGAPMGNTTGHPWATLRGTHGQHYGAPMGNTMGHPWATPRHGMAGPPAIEAADMGNVTAHARHHVTHVSHGRVKAWACPFRQAGTRGTGRDEPMSIRITHAPALTRVRAACAMQSGTKRARRPGPNSKLDLGTLDDLRAANKGGLDPDGVLSWQLANVSATKRLLPPPPPTPAHHRTPCLPHPASTSLPSTHTLSGQPFPLPFSSDCHCCGGCSMRNKYQSAVSGVSAGWLAAFRPAAWCSLHVNCQPAASRAVNIERMVWGTPSMGM